MVELVPRAMCVCAYNMIFLLRQKLLSYFKSPSLPLTHSLTLCKKSSTALSHFTKFSILCISLSLDLLSSIFFISFGNESIWRVFFSIFSFPFAHFVVGTYFLFCSFFNPKIYTTIFFRAFYFGYKIWHRKWVYI